MAEDGYVDRGTILYVLRANRVLVQVQGDGLVLLVKGDISDKMPIPQECARKLVRHLSRKFEIPIYQFYNPLMCPPLPGEPTQ